MDEFRRQATPCARKEHECDLCGETIEKGEQYVHIVQSDSGNIFDNMYHIGCYDIVARYCRECDADDWYDEGLVLNDIDERVCSSCGLHTTCIFGYRRSPLCPMVIEKYRKKDENFQGKKRGGRNDGTIPSDS